MQFVMPIHLPAGCQTHTSSVYEEIYQTVPYNEMYVLCGRRNICLKVSLKIVHNISNVSFVLFFLWEKEHLFEGFSLR